MLTARQVQKINKQFTGNPANKANICWLNWLSHHTPQTPAREPMKNAGTSSIAPGTRVLINTKGSNKTNQRQWDGFIGTATSPTPTYPQRPTTADRNNTVGGRFFLPGKPEPG